MDAPRTILHVDMDAFFAAVEQLDRPELRGKPVLVGSDRPRGVVTTASYEARPFGCRSAQPMSVARRLCPGAIVVPVRGKRYREISDRVFAILRDVTPLVEPLSIDEAFLDVAGVARLHGDGVTIARTIKQRIRADVGLTASVGVAGNKFLAKLASDMDKPDGLTVISAERARAVLDPLPVGRLPGVGPAAEARLRSLGLRTVADLRRADPEMLVRQFGEWGRRLARLSRGEDDRPVVLDSAVKSISHEQTFETDLSDPARVRRVLLDHVERVGRRLRGAGVLARGATVKIRFGEFQTVTRSCRLDPPTDATAALWVAAAGLFDRWAAGGFRPVRLIGFAAGDLEVGAGQLRLFDDPEARRARELDDATDRIVKKFGAGAIRRGGTLED